MNFVIPVNSLEKILNVKSQKGDARFFLKQDRRIANNICKTLFQACSWTKA